MENQDSFINELWVNWKLDCAVIVYCSFLTKCMTANEGDLDYGDILELSYYLYEEEFLLKEMLHAFEVAESKEDGDRKVQIMSLKEGFQSLQSRFLDQVINCLGDSYSLLHDFDTINLGKGIERYKNVIRNNDNPYPSAACALSAPLLHLRLHCYLAEYISDRFFHHNSLLDTYSSEAAKSLLLRGEEFLLCSDQDIDKAKEMYVEAMMSEMEVFFSRGGIGMAEVGIPLSRLKCYTNLQTNKESFVIEQPLGIFFSATSTLSPSTQMVLARSLANSEYEEFVNKTLINATSTSFEYSTLSQVVNQMVLIRESVAHSDVGDFEPTFEYGFEKFLHNCLKVGLPLYSKVHENWLLHQIGPSISASGLNLVSDLEDFRTIKSALNPGTKIVYIGDSITDFSYLLEADIGIIIREESHLKEFGNHFGLKFVPLLKWLTGECIEHFDQWGPKTGRLFSVESWVEVHAFLIGHYGISEVPLFHGYTV